jgi:hypothetical protein
MAVPKERIAFAIAVVGNIYLGTSNAIRTGTVLGANSSLYFFAALAFLLVLAVDVFYGGNAAN